MSGIILCKNECSKRPFYIESISVNVYSMEEICYFIYNYTFLVDEAFFSEDFFSFMEKDIGEPKLAAHIRRMCDRGAECSDMALVILRYVDYYSKKELELLEEKIRETGRLNEHQRMKSKADKYVVLKKYNSALNCYNTLLENVENIRQEDEFFSNIWHNMGVAYAGLFKFTEAAKCFEKACELNENEEDKRSVLIASVMAEINTKKGDFLENLNAAISIGVTATEKADSANAMADDWMVSEHTGIKETIDKVLDSLPQEDLYIKIQKLHECRVNGRMAEFDDIAKELIGYWKEDYLVYTK